MRFLMRDGCHLCDDARPLVREAAARAGANLVEIDVDHDDVLSSRYGLRIPVVLGPEDQVLAEGIIDDAEALQTALAGLGP